MHAAGAIFFFCSLYFICTFFVLALPFVLYCTTHTTQTSMPPAGFEPAIAASYRLQTLALDRSSTGIGTCESEEQSQRNTKYSPIALDIQFLPHSFVLHFSDPYWTCDSVCHLLTLFRFLLCSCSFATL
jgi:hypothetical protein